MRIFSSPTNPLSIGFNHIFVRSKIAPEAPAVKCRSEVRRKLKAWVSFHEIYLLSHELAPLRCTRWHISIANAGPNEVIVTGWELVTYKSLYQRAWGNTTVLRTDVGEAIQLLPAQPDLPGCALSPNAILQLFAVTEPDTDLVKLYPVYLRIFSTGGVKYVRIRYLR